MPDPNTAPARSTSPTRRVLTLLLKLGLTAVILYFVGRQVWQHWESVESFDWQVNLWYLVPSLLCAHVALFLFAFSWTRIVSGFGHRINVPMGYKIFNLSNLGRYIPGKVWQVFGMLYLARREGVPEEQAAASFVIFQLFTIPASLLVYVGCAQLEPSLLTDNFALLGSNSAYLIGAAALIGCAVLVFYPQPFLDLANWGLRKMGRPGATFLLDKRVALFAFAGYVLGWTCFGLAYWLFLKAVLGDAAPPVLASIGLYNIAYQIGYLALFAPGGLGPRELVMGELLKPFVGPVGPTLAVVARLWSVLVDTSSALVALCIRRRD